MKIRSIDCHVLNPGRRVSWGTGWSKNTVIVQVHTDEGIDGIGEAFHSLDEPIAGAVEKFTRSLVGRDPTEVQRNWQRVFRGLRYQLGTAELAALSAIEQAMWDIAGKAAGLPVYKLLGGPTRDRIRVYASGYLCQPQHFEIEGGDLVDACTACADSGFTAVKFTPQPDDYDDLTPAEVHAAAVERVRTVREAVGDGVDICLDYHGRSFSPADAVRLARDIEEYRPMFLEEPSRTEDVDGLAESKAKSSIPIAAGERTSTTAQLLELLDKRAIHIFQPEPTANGGILQTVKWAAMCEARQVSIAPHQACGPVSLLVCAHIDASIENFLIQECNVDLDDPFYRDLFTPLPTVRDGYLELPEAPGLGIELNRDALDKYPAKPYDRPIITNADGSTGLE